jgi:uncharacterized protein (TIGR00266 family)
MSSDIAIETQARGGLIKSLARSMLGGESFFINTYRAAGGGGTMTLAPALPGDMFVLDLKGDSLLVQSGSYVASGGSVEVDTRWGGGKTFFASEGLVLLHASGSGLLILSSYGAIDDVSLGSGEMLTIDTGHLVAFSEGIGFNVRSIGGVKSTLFSGEGLVVDLRGPGRVLMQTRSQDAFLAWLIPQLPSDGNS